MATRRFVRDFVVTWYVD